MIITIMPRSDLVRKLNCNVTVVLLYSCTEDEKQAARFQKN